MTILVGGAKYKMVCAHTHNTAHVVRYGELISYNKSRTILMDLKQTRSSTKVY